jgi:hypothetical protein
MLNLMQILYKMGTYHFPLSSSSSLIYKQPLSFFSTLFFRRNPNWTTSSPALDCSHGPLLASLLTKKKSDLKRQKNNLKNLRQGDHHRPPPPPRPLPLLLSYFPSPFFSYVEVQATISLLQC